GVGAARLLRFALSRCRGFLLRGRRQALCTCDCDCDGDQPVLNGFAFVPPAGAVEADRLVAKAMSRAIAPLSVKRASTPLRYPPPMRLPRRVAAIAVLLFLSFGTAHAV